jgi:hypothetical protein
MWYLKVKGKALGGFATSGAICPTTQRYVPRTCMSRSTSHRRGWRLTFCDLRSSCGTYDILSSRCVAVCSPAGCAAAITTGATWLLTRTCYSAWTNLTWLNLRTLCDSTVRDDARDDKCYEDSWRKARHGFCDPLRTVRSTWKWQQYHKSTLVLNRSLVELKRPRREAYI